MVPVLFDYQKSVRYCIIIFICIAKTQSRWLRYVYEYNASEVIDSAEKFRSFNFEPPWIHRRHFWDDYFEERYQSAKQAEKLLSPKPPLKVFVIPHSHNDPGWLMTFEEYYFSKTKSILSNMVRKLTMFKNMTFVWSEISFLSRWWEEAHHTEKAQFIQLIDERRLEIVTGGWVMTDEATTHIYATIDQLIEGHQWVRSTLGVEVKSGWSIDPFGHGSTMPYLLKLANVKGTVIQRIHYAWKRYMAETRTGDFYWRQNWDTTGSTDMLTHNMPFDIYSIKHSCGPDPEVCLQFDFYKGPPGEFSESRLYSVPIDVGNIRQKCDALAEQYEKTASLTPYNVLMVPLGDDFRYYRESEFDQQYRNYQRMFEFINANPQLYNVQVKFGTPSEYFEELSQYRRSDFATLRGDFFPYADIFSRGVPDYWTGYYTTRPAAKILGRHLETNLRSAEILFTFAYNLARQTGRELPTELFERDYVELSDARRNLALFQHHDAVTGTSKVQVMADYAQRLRNSIESAYNIQAYAAQYLLMGTKPGEEKKVKMMKSVTIPSNVESERDTIIVFNSLARDRDDVIRWTVSTPYVKVRDNFGTVLHHQISPVWIISFDAQTNRQTYSINENQFELSFIANLNALSLNTFHVETIRRRRIPPFFIADVYCRGCLNVRGHVFPINPIARQDILLENNKIESVVDGNTGFLKAISRKNSGNVVYTNTTFEGYANSFSGTGAYLFKTASEVSGPSQDILPEHSDSLIVIRGSLYSQVYVNYGHGLLSHKIQINHHNGSLGDAIYFENVVDISASKSETQIYWRFSTSVNNGEEFYTDANGLSTQRRRSNDRLNIEANYYPIATSIFIEDGAQRLTLLVDHAQGASSWKSGLLEVMLDRRLFRDDARGLGEGVTDNERTPMRYCLLLESIVEPIVGRSRPSSNAYVRPSPLSNRLSDYLIYPSNVYAMQIPPEYAAYYEREFKGSLNLISRPLPDDVHLINFKTGRDYYMGNNTPSRSATMILHRRGYDSEIKGYARSYDMQDYPASYEYDNMAFLPHTNFTNLEIRQITRTSLTGSEDIVTFRSFDDVILQPMGIDALVVRFGDG